MLSGFHVFHKKNPTGKEILPHAECVTFKTCLRWIHFAWFNDENLPSLQADYEVFKDVKAYQFVLEIICGLHSPVVGETEVFGQFRNFWQTTKVEYPLQQIFSHLISDAKKVRGLHLIDLGGQSYGSLIRKEINSPADVTFIGSGSLVQDILPWVYKDENRITLCVRDVEKAKAIYSEKYPRLSFSQLGKDKVSSQVVIVAAPVEASLIEESIENQDARVIDLRGESRTDGCRRFSHYKDLSTFFAIIQHNQQQISQAKALALNAIDQISHQRYFVESFRPFGWDDICVW